MSRSSLKLSCSYTSYIKTGVKKQRELQQQLEIVWLIKFLGHCLEYDYATYFLVSLGIFNIINRVLQSFAVMPVF